MTEAAPPDIEYGPEFGEPKRKTISWHSPADVLPNTLTLSGLEYLTGVKEGRIPPPPMGGWTISSLDSVSEGEVVLRGRPDESFLNPMGMVHGGLLCTLMDSAVGMAVISKLAPGQAFASIELKVSFLRPLPWDGRCVEVRGTALQVGRKVAFAEAHAYDEDGRRLGHATSSLAAIAP